MPENEFPLATSPNQAGLPTSPTLSNDNYVESNMDSGVNQNIPTTNTVGDEIGTDPGLDDRGAGRVQGFLSSGEVLRKVIILCFLILFLTAGIFGLISLQSADSNSNHRQLGTFSPKDIGPVLDFLELNGYPYTLGGNDTILVPVDQYSTIREAMLRRGVGVQQLSQDARNEIIMQDSGFGVSQRLEGERINHGRELQLARAIERIDGVEHATVLLAIPKENVFARQQNRPTAAVVVTLKPGSYLTPENVKSIRFTVASSVRNMLFKDVSVTDHTGRLLSSDFATNATDDRLQKEFELRTLREAQYRNKLDSILAPMLGVGNYSAEVDVTLDTTLEEETRQMFNPDGQVVLSETLREKVGGEEKNGPYGVPGSLSNQPPANASIPQSLKDGSGFASQDSQKDESREAVRNYEVDKTIRHTVRPTNSVTRLTVSVAVDYIKEKDANGIETWVPRPQADLDKIAELVKGGLGLDERRGDFVSVATVEFPHPEILPPLPWWQQDSFIRIAKVFGAVLVILVLVIFVIRPMVNKLLRNKTEEETLLDDDLDTASALAGDDDLSTIAAKVDLDDQIYTINKQGSIVLPNLRREHDLLKAVRTLVSNEPQLSAEVIREWINKDSAKEKKDKK